MKQRKPSEQIPHVCLNELYKYSKTNCIDDKVVLIDYLPEGERCIDFVLLLFCTEHESLLYMNGEPYRMKPGQVLLANKGTLLRRGPDTPWSGKLLCLSWEYAQTLFMRSNCGWKLILQMHENPRLTPQPDEATLFAAYYQLFSAKVKSYHYTPQIDLDNLFQGFFHDFYLMTCRQLTRNKPSDKRPVGYSRQEELFKRFIALVKENHAREHFLSFYADRLCITPKYLTAVVKQVSGRNASKWIDACIVDQVRMYLKTTQLTISEIAYKLNFSNNSFFGKYVKAQTGYSPLELRRRLQTA